MVLIMVVILSFFLTVHLSILCSKTSENPSSLFVNVARGPPHSFHLFPKSLSWRRNPRLNDLQGDFQTLSHKKLCVVRWMGSVQTWVSVSSWPPAWKPFWIPAVQCRNLMLCDCQPDKEDSRWRECDGVRADGGLWQWGHLFSSGLWAHPEDRLHNVFSVLGENVGIYCLSSLKWELLIFFIAITSCAIQGQ